MPALFGLSAFTFVNTLALILISCIDWLASSLILESMHARGFIALFRGNLFIFGIFTVLQIIGLFLLTKLTLHLILRFSPKRRLDRMGKALHTALAQASMLSGKTGRIQVDSNPIQSYFTVSLKGVSLHDQHVFAEACKQMLSPIDNPRYVLIEQSGAGLFGILHYRHSFACPEVLSKRKEDVTLLVDALKPFGTYKAVYIKSPEGREKLWRCRERALVNLNERYTKIFLGL
ncbi:hypothetical protein IV72_GL001192 [Atopobium minutum]|nr:hypothetical protein IV72_GL001192 [Atopobium minutum]